MTLHLYPDLEQGLSENDIRRFWTFVQQRGGDECWEWSGYTSSNGYGKMWLRGKFPGAHRLSYVINNGPIPDGHMIRHTCDNKSCVRPTHLITGTGLDNARDALERDRYLRGSDNPRAKLTPEQVAEIRRRSRQGDTQVALARTFGVSRAAIQWILKGRNWAKVGESA